MLIRCTGLFLFASLLAASAAPAPVSGPSQTYDVPMKGAPQMVAIMTRVFAPGQTAGRHIHHGVEMTIVVKGELELMVQGQPNRIYHAGQSFIVPRDTPHDARNPGSQPATLAITYVVDKGKPLRVPVP